MLKYLLSIMLFALLVIGCNQESNILSPQDSSNNNLAVNEPNWITTPANMSLKKDVAGSQWVSGREGAVLNINQNYHGGSFGWVFISASAEFQRYSFGGYRYVTMSVNDQCGVATFSPHGSFRRPVIYNLTIQGIDLSNVDPATVRFVYMADNGKYYPADCDTIIVNKQSGRLKVVNAKLPHFSRYGFVN